MYLNRIAELAALEDKLQILRSKWDAMIVQYPRLNKSANKDAIWQALVDSDPTKNKQYLQWILVKGISQWKTKSVHLFLEDLKSTLFETLETFKKLSDKKKLGEVDRDINRFPSSDALFDAIEKYQDVSLDNDKDIEKKFYENKEATLFYDSPRIKIVIPHTKETSCFFGRNTQWCTAGKQNNMFNEYNKRGPLYIILHKSTNKRWQFWFVNAKTQSGGYYTNQFMNERDYPIDFKEFRKHSAYKEIQKALAKPIKESGDIRLMEKPTEAQTVKFIDNGPLFDDEEIVEWDDPPAASTTQSFFAILDLLPIPYPKAVYRILKKLLFESEYGDDVYDSNSIISYFTDYDGIEQFTKLMTAAAPLLTIPQKIDFGKRYVRALIEFDHSFDDLSADYEDLVTWDDDDDYIESVDVDKDPILAILFGKSIPSVVRKLAAAE